MSLNTPNNAPQGDQKPSGPAFTATQAQRDAVIEMGRKGEPISVMAQVIGVSIPVLKEEFSYELWVSEQIAESGLLAHLYKQALDGDSKAGDTWLKNTADHRELRNLNTRIARQKLRTATSEADIAELRAIAARKNPDGLMPTNYADMEAEMNRLREIEEQYDKLTGRA